nr:probable RNA-dependent RNA polymerase 3 isoform X2 [Physcomitrium patens]|eukprot:XP_024378193.1 probable RNA-dependent RNA polymerase 3 isoform X2 [Physcomitrella patens]
MRGVRKLLSWAALNGCEEEDSKFTSGSKFTSPVKNPWNLEVESDEEEFVDSSGRFENEEKVSENSTSSKSSSDSGHGRSDACGRCSGADRKRLIENFLSSGEEREDPLMHHFWKFLSDIEAAVTPVSLGHVQGFEKTRSEYRLSSPATTLKQTQLEKLEKLTPLDKDWNCLYPSVAEDQFCWPWIDLTEPQLALGKLDFEKFMVTLSCLGELDLQPEKVLTLEQIKKLERLDLEDVAGYVSREVAISRGVRDEEVPRISKEWLTKGPFSFECNVDKHGVCKFKVVKPRPASTLLHRTFGEDRVMPVYFNESPTEDKFQLVRDGILVGLRRYRLWTFKDSGKEEFSNRSKPYDKDYQRAVKCIFICTESLADVDLADSNFKYFKTIEAARCHIVHIHTVPTMSKFASRLQLALSKSVTANLNWDEIKVRQIPDILSTTLDNSGKFMSHTEGTAEISPDVARLIPCSVFKGKVNKSMGYPTLIQGRLFWKGMAIKGTWQVNHQLKGLQILYRPSMVKVTTDAALKDFPTINSFEIVNTNTCYKLKEEAKLSQDLIFLLSVNNVPASFFLEHVEKALENLHSFFTTRGQVFRELKRCSQDYDVGDQTLRMIMANIPMNNPQMQKNLKKISQDKIALLRKGCVPLPQSCYLMGTCDPTKERVLKPNEVAVIKNGDKVLGKVLVYKNPGKHWGDVHVFDAVWDERLNPYVGPANQTIFFSVRGNRPVVDEIANSDLDGDFYWVCFNTQLISLFTPSPPWTRIGERTSYPVGNGPSSLTPRAAEYALFEKFLNSRFKTYKPMPLSATYWIAHMDRYLTLKYADEYSEELELLSETILELIDIFYRALDADKTGEEVKLRRGLEPKCYPHFMRKQNQTSRRTYYTSTSILGQIYDMVDKNADRLGYRPEETIAYDPKFEFGRFDRYIENWRGLLQQYNKDTQAAFKNNELDRVIARYQEILKGQNKSIIQVLEEASALYIVNHEHAEMTLRKGYTPTLNCAWNVALEYLCEIYASQEERKPYILSASAREDIFGPSNSES